MILFDLRCRAGHVFEAWFRDGETCERQLARGVVSCPICGAEAREKAPMAPRLAFGRPPAERPGEPAGGAAAGPEAAGGKELFRLLAEIGRHVVATCEDVGERFPEEARRIHYGEAEARGIYGEASPAEARALREEGIAVIPFPWLRRRHDA